MRIQDFSGSISYHSFGLIAKARARLTRRGLCGNEVIILCAASLEAFANELPVIAAIDENDYAVPSIAALVEMLDLLESEKASAKLKYQVIYFIVTGKPVRRGHEPLQSLFKLFEVRKSILHPDAEFIEQRDGLVKRPERARRTIEFLIAKAALPVHVADVSPMLQILDCFEPGAWAYKTVIAVVRDIVDKLPASHAKNVCDFFVREQLRDL